MLPTDIVIADAFSADANTQIVAADAIPDGWQGLDIGPATRETFAEVIGDAATVFWNGPSGVFEFPAFAAGTKAVAEAIAAGSSFSVVGGGDSAAAVRLLGVDESRLHPHLDRGWRVPGVPRGRRTSRRRRAGELTWHDGTRTADQASQARTAGCC